MTLVQTSPKKITIWKSSRLPSAYQEVEYIQSNGTQYFIVGSSFKTSYKTVIDLQMTVIGGDYIPVGVNKSSPFIRYGIDFDQGYARIISGGSGWTNTIVEDTNRHTITIDKSTATVDGTDYSISYSDDILSGGLGVFCYNQTNSLPQYFSSNKLYKLDIYDENGTPIHDLVPCYRIADSEIGMYDIITDTFYTNQGSGTFTKGNDVNGIEKEIKKIIIRPTQPRLPAAYQEVEYIQSSGTQYIETGYSSNSTYFKAEYKINMTDLQEAAGSNNPAFPFGIVEGGQIYQTFRNPTSPADTQWGAGNSDLFSTQIAELTDYEIMAEWNNGILNTNINGTTDAQSYSGSLGSHTIPIFCRWRNTYSGYNYNAKMKLYYFKMYSSSNTLVRDLVPCYRKADSIIGMYDLVNDVFYTNSGTGTFTRGNEVDCGKKIRPVRRIPASYQEVEYIQSTGTQRMQIGTSFKTSYKTVIDLQMDVIGGDYVPLGMSGGNSYRYAINAWESYIKIITGGNQWKNTIAEDTNRHVITIDKSTATVDGNSYSLYYSNYTFNFGIGVFCYKGQNNAANLSSNKLYMLDIYDENGVLIYNLVPCYRISDGEIGLYDLVNGTFYTNQGSGTFTKGADVN